MTGGAAKHGGLVVDEGVSASGAAKTTAAGLPIRAAVGAPGVYRVDGTLHLARDEDREREVGAGGAREGEQNPAITKPHRGVQEGRRYR